ncbi:type IV pilus biogenesis/stability protein PilW [Acidovorax sp. HDW3]|uniref:type IV pilus biogenesis/stability protein PilW n=1 Tax=Acidovorax sp. HDW3 TaxID=2714923 RepID=UPI00140B60DD|nr:type IV pilus biogenesis/stability protein PilW [Acidovorax sp. HDW3]QIL45438.1 type IV pilus biogenesis/stability protein PilW [Acidovorax sp. HDW3]
METVMGAWWRQSRALGAAGLVWVALSGLTGCATQPGAQGQDMGSISSVSDTEETEVHRRARIRLELAANYLERGQLEVALNELKQALAIEPNYADAYNLRGLIFMRMDDPGLAEDSFRRAMALRPNDPDVAHNYGWLLCQQKKFTPAQEQFERALAVRNYAARSRTYMALGLCQDASGRSETALQNLLKSYELDPANPVVAYNLAILLQRQGDLERAQFYIRRLNNSELANAQSLWLGIKIERALHNEVAMRQLGEQLHKRFPESKEFGAYTREAFND